MGWVRVALATLAGLAVARANVQVPGSTPHSLSNGDRYYGTLSPGYIMVRSGAALRQKSGDTMNADTMSSIVMNTGSTMDQAGSTHMRIGEYSFATLDVGCHMTMAPAANIRAEPSADSIPGRLEMYCNQTLSMGTQSLLQMAPQTLLFTNDSFTMGNGIIVKMHEGAALEVQNALIIQDFVYFTLEDHAAFQIKNTSTGVVTVTSGKNEQQPTQVLLKPSARIVVEGAITIGSGQDTKVVLYDSGLLLIKPGATFSIASSTFDIGPSSFWIIDGVFNFDEGSNLVSGLQSNITISTLDPKKPANFKSTSGGNVTVSAGASLSVTGSAQISGTFHMDSSTNVNIAGSIDLTATNIIVDYAAHVDIAGNLDGSKGPARIRVMPASYLSIGGSLTTNPSAAIVNGPSATMVIAGTSTVSSSLTLGKAAELDVDSTCNLQVAGPLNMGPASQLQLLKKASLKLFGSLDIGARASLSISGVQCFFLQPTVIPPYQNIVIDPKHPPSAKSFKGVTCMPV